TRFRGGNQWPSTLPAKGLKAPHALPGTTMLQSISRWRRHFGLVHVRGRRAPSKFQSSRGFHSAPGLVRIDSGSHGIPWIVPCISGSPTRVSVDRFVPSGAAPYIDAGGVRMSRLDIYRKQAKQLVRWHREG